MISSVLKIFMAATKHLGIAMSKLTCFKTYDIRGELGHEFNDDIAYRIGRAYGMYLNPRQVVVGGDARLTSESLKLSVARGLQDAGVDVLDIGMSGTEEIYFATFHLAVDGGIEITASHNPIKLVKENAIPISGESGLEQIRRLAEENNFPLVDESHRGKYKRISILDDYVDHLMSYIDLANFDKPLKLVINSGNGAAGHVIDEIEKRFKKHKIPLIFVKIHNNPDGNFPHGIPNPLLPECRKDTSDAVVSSKADMGIAFDGDFDRCFFFDENANFIEGYYIVGLLAESFLRKKPSSKIIYDPRLVWNTESIIQSLDGEAIVSKTGHAFIKDRMRKEDAIYGGEMSAHHYFRDFSYCDSGMIPWLLIAELISGKSEALSKFVERRIEAFPSSGEINRKVDNPKEVIDKIKQAYEKAATAIEHIDGLSMSFPEWRFNLRCSNTEPLIRLNVESKGDEKLMQMKTEELINLIDCQAKNLLISIE